MLLLVIAATASLPVLDPMAYSWCYPPTVGFSPGDCPLLVNVAGRAMCCFDAEPVPETMAWCALLMPDDTFCNTVATADDRAMAWCCQDDQSPKTPTARTTPTPPTTSWPTDYSP
jgi:hypothetical protein